MAKYVAILKQRAEGCDYTIGCGISTYVFDANDWNDAFQKVREAYDWTEYESDDYTVEDVEDRFNGELALESCIIYEIASSMDTLYEIYVDNLIRYKQGIMEDEETRERRKQYEVLKKEFGET